LPYLKDMKIDQAQFYRARADGERIMAEQTALPHERLRHLRAAEVWDAMAQKVEHTLTLRARNQTAKRRLNLDNVPSRARVSRVTRRA